MKTILGLCLMIALLGCGRNDPPNEVGVAAGEALPAEIQKKRYR